VCNTACGSTVDGCCPVPVGPLSVTPCGWRHGTGQSTRGGRGRALEPRAGRHRWPGVACASTTREEQESALWSRRLEHVSLVTMPTWMIQKEGGL
jgi:hypothetical protein